MFGVSAALLEKLRILCTGVLLLLPREGESQGQGLPSSLGIKPSRKRQIIQQSLGIGIYRLSYQTTNSSSSSCPLVAVPNL